MNLYEKIVMEMALETLDDYVDDPRCQDRINETIKAIKYCLANSALDNMANNAREMGLRYD